MDIGLRPFCGIVGIFLLFRNTLVASSSMSKESPRHHQQRPPEFFPKWNGGGPAEKAVGFPLPSENQSSQRPFSAIDPFHELSTDFILLFAFADTFQQGGDAKVFDAAIVSKVGEGVEAALVIMTDI